ncbi:MAG: hypothetical protein ABL974_16110, partial [Prosthecobacter sp.]
MSATLQSPHAPAPQSFGDASIPSLESNDSRQAAILSIEGLALQYRLLPVTLLRESCSPDAEKFVRKLGRVPYVADPWLPVTTLGPLIVMAHHNPRAGDTWGVPGFLTIRVLITVEQYQKTRKDLAARFGQLPIAQQSAFENLESPRFDEMGLEGTFNWLMEHYPYEPVEITKLRGFYETQKEKNPVLGIGHFNIVQRNLGVALNYLVSLGKSPCYSAQEAQRQTFFPLPLLERHNVYPLYIGKNAVFMLSEHSDSYVFEDEWLSMGNPAMKVITVLSDPASIRDAINRSGATFDPSGVASMDKSALSVSANESVIDIMPEDMARINPSSPHHTAEELVQWAIFTAIRCRASDLHLEKFYNLARFRARMDGNMKTILTAPEAMLNRFVALIKNYAGMNQNRQEAQDGRFALSIG